MSDGSKINPMLTLRIMQKEPDILKMRSVNMPRSRIWMRSLSQIIKDVSVQQM